MPTSHRAIGSSTSYRSVVCYSRKGFMNPKVVKFHEESEKKCDENRFAAGKKPKD
jgi:hypothetical protein